MYTDWRDSLVGYGYHRYYKSIVLQKIDNAFQKGDPALKLAGDDVGDARLLVDVDPMRGGVLAGDAEAE